MEKSTPAIKEFVGQVVVSEPSAETIGFISQVMKDAGLTFTEEAAVVAWFNAKYVRESTIQQLDTKG